MLFGPSFNMNPFGHSEPFTRHGTPKRYSASVLRPGNRSGSGKPTCTAAQAKEHASSRSGTRRGGKAHEAWLEQMEKVAA